MKSIIATTETSAPQLLDRDVPQLNEGDVLVEVYASTVNPIDVQSPSPEGREGFGLKDDFGLGWEFSGVVSKSDNPSYKTGDRVIGITPHIGSPSAAHAEYVAVPAEQLAPLPESIPFNDAATLAMNGSTAYQALQLLDAPDGRDLLITGGAGAVGGYALELAKDSGEWGTVYAVAREEDREFVEQRGAQLVTSVEKFTADGNQVAAVLDTATIPDAVVPAIVDGGNYVGVLPPAPVKTPRGITSRTVGVREDAELLKALATKAAEGVLTTRIDNTYDARSDFSKAWDRLAASGVRGRQVLVWRS